MKSMLMYNYNFINPIITRSIDNVYIKDNNKVYIFCKLKDESPEIIKYTNEDNTFYKSIQNINKNYVTLYKGKYYILFEVSKKTTFDVKDIIKKREVLEEGKNNWIEKWTLKLDEIDKATKIINDEYINETKDYYLGLGETALDFLIYNKDKLDSDDKFLCRKRINKKTFKFPTNGIIDNKERDISEYIKYLYFQENYTVEEIILFIKKIDFSEYNKYLVYGRLLFPTYYFDIIDDYFDRQVNVTEEVKKIIYKVDSYEILLDKIFNILFKNTEYIIEWNKK